MIRVVVTMIAITPTVEATVRMQVTSNIRSDKPLELIE